jgi:hypothetical protein
MRDYSEVHNVLNEFAPIGLEDMGAVRLMSRIDNKYVIPVKLLPSILEQVKEHYFVFEIHGKRAHEYKTLYYDTDDLLLYKTHHQGKLNRYKIRERTYDTIKSRIKIDQLHDLIEGNRSEFLKQISGLDGSAFKPKLWVLYYRITLVSKALNERSTIDLNLTFDNYNNTVSYDDLVVIEAKRDKTVKTTPMLQALKENRLREGGFSKYCLGHASTNPDIKHNGFKKKFHKITQLRKRYSL